MSVRSRGRYVPRPAPLTARKLRSPQDLNRRRPLARPIPTGPPRRSMFASTTRPVRHNTPLPLSIVARPHEAGLLRSWRADSLAFVWLDPGITPCWRNRHTEGAERLVHFLKPTIITRGIVRRLTLDFTDALQRLRSAQRGERWWPGDQLGKRNFADGRLWTTLCLE